MSAYTQAQARIADRARRNGWTVTDERASNGALIALHFNKSGRSPIIAVYRWAKSGRFNYARTRPAGAMTRLVDTLTEWLDR